MLLATVLHHHEGALRASLMSEYGLRLREALTWPAREVADLVAWLPAGSALWADYGGPTALSEQVHALRMVDYRLQVLDYHTRQGKGSKPKAPVDPPYARDRREQQDAMDRKAQAYLRRQGLA